MSTFPRRVIVGAVDTCSSPRCLRVHQWLLVAVLRALSGHSNALGSHKGKVKGAREPTRFLGVALNHRCMGTMDQYDNFLPFQAERRWGRSVVLHRGDLLGDTPGLLLPFPVLRASSLSVFLGSPPSPADIPICVSVSDLGGPTVGQGTQYLTPDHLEDALMSLCL